METNPKVIATITSHPISGEVFDILPGEQEHHTLSVAHLTEDHIDELVQINQAFYRNFLTKAIKDFPIL